MSDFMMYFGLIGWVAAIFLGVALCDACKRGDRSWVRR